VPDTHLVVYRNTGELKQRLRELLNAPEKQDSIRFAGQRLVNGQHQYRQMAQHFLDQFREVEESRKPRQGEAHAQ